MVDFGSYDMSDIMSPLDRLPYIIRRPSFFGDAPSSFLSMGMDDGGIKGKSGAKGDESPRGRKDSVMTGVYGSTSGSSASVSVLSVVSCKKPAVTVRKRVLGVDEKGESSRSAEESLRPREGSRNDGHKATAKAKGRHGGDDTREKAPSPVAPRRSRFVEDLGGVRAEAVDRTPAEVCQQVCLPDPPGTAAKGDGSVKLYFPPAAAVPLQKERRRPVLEQGYSHAPAPAPTPPSPGWLCHHDGACLGKKGRRRRKFAQAVVRLTTKPARWRKGDKGKSRAACEVCGDDAPPDLRGSWERGRDGAAPGSEGGSDAADEVAELLSLLYDRDEAESSRRCSGCGQKVCEELVPEEDDGDGRAEGEKEESDKIMLGSKEEAADPGSKAAAAGFTAMPEAWWTRWSLL
ncbi:hypothetical protein LZ30DRAFT_592701 [Colletotrichum cereale]|nr:hypothetical protein LZ30DRAFT_592701 [Colletotrichum cereale]